MWRSRGQKPPFSKEQSGQSKTKLSRANIKVYSSMSSTWGLCWNHLGSKGLGQLHSSGSATYSMCDLCLGLELSLGDIPVSSILRSPLTFKHYLHSSTHWPEGQGLLSGNLTLPHLIWPWWLASILVYASTTTFLFRLS